MDQNYCVGCGAEIPEGQMICPDCRERAGDRTTALEQVFYRYMLKKRMKTEEKFVCRKCRYAFDNQARAFRYCPGCGRQVIETVRGSV